MISLLFEDEDFLVLNKAPGWPSHATLDPKRKNALGEARLYLQSRSPIPTDSKAPYLVHRLDAGTSGVLLFAKTKTLAESLALGFRERRIKKTYLAWTRPRQGPRQWIVKNHLKEAKIEGRRKMIPVRSGGDLAETEFEVLNQNSTGSLIQARPLTGRMHQIRTHLAESLCPIFGDSLYGGPTSERLWLHAWTLELEDPRHQGQRLYFVAPPPQTPWPELSKGLHPKSPL